MKFISRHEGFSKKLYKDQGGYLTIGYGHLVHNAAKYEKGISKSEGLKLLARDVQKAVAAVNAAIKGFLGQTKFDSLTSFTYNVGPNGFRGSTLLRNIKNGKPVTQGNFTEWDKVGTTVSQGLLSRRIAEYELYSNGNYGGP